MANSLDSLRQAYQEHFRRVQENMRVAVEHAADLVLEEMKEEVDLQDHSLQDLRRMGHPYRKDAPADQPHPDWLVHYQSGDLRGGLSHTDPLVTETKAEVEIHSAAPYTWYLLLGTRYMRPRDFVTHSVETRRGAVEQTYEYYFEKAHKGRTASRVEAE